MSDFWPTGINLADTQSPKQILNEARDDWETNSKGLLTLVLQTAKSNGGHDMIVVHAKHISSNRTGSLFSVLHRPNSPYPVTILPNDDDLPDILRKTYYQAGYNANAFLNPASVFGKVEGKTVVNEWVAETPSEFRKNLKAAFNLGSVKSIVLNLSSTIAISKHDDGEAASGESTLEGEE